MSATAATNAGVYQSRRSDFVEKDAGISLSQCSGDAGKPQRAG
jgi:hypothetical protein